MDIVSRADRIAQLKRLLQKAKVLGYITRAQVRIIEEHEKSDPDFMNKGEPANLITELRSYVIREYPIRDFRVLPVIAIFFLAMGCSDQELQKVKDGAIRFVEVFVGPAPMEIKGEPSPPPSNLSRLTEDKIGYPIKGTLYPDQIRILEGLSWPQGQTDLIGSLGEPLILQADGMIYQHWNGQTIKIPCDWQGCQGPTQ
ncbi:MAG: hypothetical protein ACKO5P_04930 [Nodosilinea sp.]